LLSAIESFDAHIYYDEEHFDQAKSLIEAAGAAFSLRVGEMHRKPVGPHPCWSCVLEFEPALFGKLIPWLMLKRNGLVVFVHPNTGEDLKDHLDRALWMGEIKPLRLSLFR